MIAFLIVEVGERDGGALEDRQQPTLSDDSVRRENAEAFYKGVSQKLSSVERSLKAIRRRRKYQSLDAKAETSAALAVLDELHL